MSIFHKSFRMLMVVAGLAIATATLAAEVPTVAGSCREDLARRLGLDVGQVQIEQVIPVTWSSGAWGLEKPGMVYTKALVPGFRIKLHAPAGRYFYHTSTNGFRYAGREEMWAASALYLEPVEDEPNLNGNLTQISLLGTNPQLLLAGVASFAPQKNGAVLATRRTSRSGFDLLYLAPDKIGEARVLGGAFDLACPVLSPAGDRYAVFYRLMVGMPWQVRRAGLEGEPQDLPDLPVAGQPFSLTWEPDEPLTATVRTDAGLRGWRLIEAEGKMSWEPTAVGPDDPGHFSLLLNRSETLVIETVTEEGKPVTRVHRDFFLGDVTEIATVKDFSLKSVELTQGLGLALLVGERAEMLTAVTVDLRTGEVLETVPTTPYPVHLLNRASHWEPALTGF
jgi:hypothetical protein